jgi:hypothetical protein
VNDCSQPLSFPADSPRLRHLGDPIRPFFSESLRCNFLETKLGEPEVPRKGLDVRGALCGRRAGMLNVLIQFATAHPVITVLVIGVLSLIVFRAALS